MTSFCIKTNNKFDISTLPNYISTIELPNVVFVTRDFSKYTNIIIHYLGTDKDTFYQCLSDTLCNYILDNYEQNIIDKTFRYSFFYFNKDEISEIETICSSNLCEDSKRRNLLFNNILDYIKNHKSMIFSGFMNFRIYDYLDELDNLIDLSVSSYVINREYSEFIKLLHLYISSQPPCSNVVHLIYSNESSILLDENKKIISSCHNNLDIPYLSDISFSANDYALNSLLSLLPKKLIIHLEEKNVDDFINTLKLIFEDRVVIK